MLLVFIASLCANFKPETHQKIASQKNQRSQQPYLRIKGCVARARNNAVNCLCRAKVRAGQNASITVNHAGNSCIRHPNDRQAFFDSPQPRLCKMLMRACGLAKPGIITEREDHVRTLAIRSDKIRKNHFITNQNPYLPETRQIKGPGFTARPDICFSGNNINKRQPRTGTYSPNGTRCCLS